VIGVNNIDVTSFASTIGYMSRVPVFSNESDPWKSGNKKLLLSVYSIILGKIKIRFTY